MRGIFVTGTDTSVGKTVVSAAALLRYGSGARLAYWKPVQTGIEQDDDTREVARLTETTVRAQPEGIRLERPVSPHLAARLAGRTIDVDDLVRRAGAADPALRWIVEGAGGILVPLNGDALMVDLIAALDLPVLLVARSTLGTINHTLLSIEALRRRSRAVAGVVLVGPPNPENADAIRIYGRVEIVGQLPHLQPLGVDTLSSWARHEFDRVGRLAPCFA